MSARRDA